MRRLAAVLSLMAFVAAASPGRAKPPGKKTRIQGASRVHCAAWGLVAQGSGQLRILPTGQNRWQTLHHARGDTLYRVTFDDSGRLLASWEKEPHFHLFVPKTKQHQTFAKPPAPSADFKYGYSLEDLYFTKDGKGAIVYMHGFTGGRTWSEVAYYFDLDGRSEPTLLFRQPGYSLRTSSRLAVYAIPQDPKDACEDNSCYPLGAIIGWEITGAKATKKILLKGEANNKLSRVRPVWGGDEDRIAVQITEHPHKRHLLRWRWGDAKATFRPLPPGPGYDAEYMHLASAVSDDVVEAWLTDERGLEVRRHSLQGEMTVAARFAPLPRRTPNDRPLFGVSDLLHRKNGDLILYWGEYLFLLPSDGRARRLDLRSIFKRKAEFSGVVLYARDPEGLWIGLATGRVFDFAFLAYADVEARAQAVPTAGPP